jgi:cell division septation protein DedD
MSAGVPPRMDATSQAEPSTTAEEPSTAVEPSSSAARGFRVQVMAIPDSDVAQAEAQRLRALVAPTPVYVEFVSPFYKVRIGDFAARADAEQALERIRQAGYRDAWLVRAAIQASSPVQ